MAQERPAAGELAAARERLVIAHEEPAGRIVLTDSVTLCDERLRAGDVLVAGSFAGALSLGLALGFGVRAFIGHAAGVGRDEAGIGALPTADGLSRPAAAVETMSARLGDGRSVFEDGVIGHVNQMASALGLRPGLRARAGAALLLQAPRGRALPAAGLVDRRQRVVAEMPAGRVVLVQSLSFADATNARDVLCAGSHGGRVNAETLLALVRPRGVIVNDGGFARDRSGVSGLAVLDHAGVAAVAVGAMSARIGDPASAWDTGVVSAVNGVAERLGIQPGQLAQSAARAMLAPAS